LLYQPQPCRVCGFFMFCQKTLDKFSFLLIIIYGN
jgi:hypothetical protein